MSDARYCPLHGEYTISETETGCPRCRLDPAASRRSLRQVKVLDSHRLDASDQELTPIADRAPCPLCGRPIRLEDFRSEAIGEIWTGKSAEYAEEGVCTACFRDKVRPEIRSWSDTEWLAHHYEGWRGTLKQASGIEAYQANAQESWLPPDQRSHVLDVAATVERRKAHLAASRRGMMELLGRHPGDVTPPPFQLTLAAETESAIGTRAVEALHERRRADEAAEAERRLQSVADFPVSEVPEALSGRPIEEAPAEDGEQTKERRNALIALAAAFVLLLVAVGVARALLG